MLAAIRVGSAPGAASHKTSTESNATIGMASRKGGGDGAAMVMISKQASKAGKKPKKIARPMNSFMVFAQETRKALRERYPQTDNKEISKMLGQKWKSLTAAQKEEYAKQAHALAEQHKKDHPDWKFVRAPPRKGRGKAAKAAAAAASNDDHADGPGHSGNEVDRTSWNTRTQTLEAPISVKREPPTLLPINRSSPPPLSPAHSSTMLELAELEAQQRKLFERQKQIQAAAEAEKPPPPTYVAPPSLSQQGVTTTAFEDSSNPRNLSSPPFPASLEAVVAMLAN